MLLPEQSIPTHSGSINQPTMSWEESHSVDVHQHASSPIIEYFPPSIQYLAGLALKPDKFEPFPYSQPLSLLILPLASHSPLKL